MPSPTMPVAPVTIATRPSSAPILLLLLVLSGSLHGSGER